MSFLVVVSNGLLTHIHTQREKPNSTNLVNNGVRAQTADEESNPCLRDVVRGVLSQQIYLG